MVARSQIMASQNLQKRTSGECWKISVFSFGVELYQLYNVLGVLLRKIETPWSSQIYLYICGKVWVMINRELIKVPGMHFWIQMKVNRRKIISSVMNRYHFAVSLFTNDIRRKNTLMLSHAWSWMNIGWEIEFSHLPLSKNLSPKFPTFLILSCTLEFSLTFTFSSPVACLSCAKRMTSWADSLSLIWESFCRSPSFKKPKPKKG